MIRLMVVLWIDMPPNDGSKETLARIKDEVWVTLHCMGDGVEGVVHI